MRLLLIVFVLVMALLAAIGCLDQWLATALRPEPRHSVPLLQVETVRR